MKLEHESVVASKSAVSVPVSSSVGWSSKLQPRHFERIAIVYVRQSTTQQVLNNRESAARQYSLVDLAIQLGWSADRVLVIDEDQGQRPLKRGVASNVCLQKSAWIMWVSSWESS